MNTCSLVLEEAFWFVTGSPTIGKTGINGLATLFHPNNGYQDAPSSHGIGYQWDTTGSVVEDDSDGSSGIHPKRTTNQGSPHFC